MTKVYAPPKEVGESPKYDASSVTDWHSFGKTEEQWVEKIKNWAKKNGSGKLAGKEVLIPWADGYARYVVLSSKPAALVHIPVGDAWDYPHIERLTIKDIKEYIIRREKLDELFSPKSKIMK